MASPALWGAEAHLADLFGGEVTQIRCERRLFQFCDRSAAHWVQIFRDYYGPSHKAFAALDATGRQALERDVVARLAQSNTAGASSPVVVPAEYLEVVATKH